jgi:hypothetical protein
MDIDDFIQERESESPMDVVRNPIIKETIDAGNKLIDVDYFKKIKTIKELKPYIKDMTEMNLHKRGWRFQFGSSREWVGLCSSDPKTLGKTAGRNIYVSIEYVKHWKDWKENMKDTILHEIAHAIMFEIFWYDVRHRDALSKIDELHRISQGHGILWGLVCAKLKGSKERCSITVSTPNKAEEFKPYFYKCPNCGNVEYGDSKYFASKCDECRFETFIQKNKE